MIEHHPVGRRSIWSRTNIVFLGFLAIGGFFLVKEHSAHVIPYLPWLLLAVCPLMHVFMHGGHGGHGNDSGAGRGTSPDRGAKPLGSARSTLEDSHAP